MHKPFLFLCFLLLAAVGFSASVDTVSIYSAAMKKNVKCVVIKPDSYSKENAKRFPVVYLLHGAGGDYSTWIKRVPAIQKSADDYQMMIVCPDGLKTGWYFDSPINDSMRYETNVAIEIPSYIDKNYRTVTDRSKRAIAGFSMGGHGGLYLGWRHSDFFGACGSMSGAIDISLITRGYGMDKLLGDTLKNRNNYETYSFMHEMKTPPKQPIKIIIDCGTEDFIFMMSKNAHEKMMALKIQHDYIERPGKHDWPYWSNAVQYQLLFFKRFFEGEQ